MLRLFGGGVMGDYAGIPDTRLAVMPGTSHVGVMLQPEMLLGMILVGALAFLGFYFAPSFWMWFPLRAVLHVALTVLFILSEFWISMSAPPRRRGFVLGIYATVLSLGFAFGPWLFAKMGSAGFLPFGKDRCGVSTHGL